MFQNNFEIINNVSFKIGEVDGPSKEISARSDYFSSCNKDKFMFKKFET